jgi:hypothetical protein
MRDGGFAVYVALFTEFPPRAGTLTVQPPPSLPISGYCALLFRIKGTANQSRGKPIEHLLDGLRAIYDPGTGVLPSHAKEQAAGRFEFSGGAVGALHHNLTKTLKECDLEGLFEHNRERPPVVAALEAITASLQGSDESLHNAKRARHQTPRDGDIQVSAAWSDEHGTVPVVPVNGALLALSTGAAHRSCGLSNDRMCDREVVRNLNLPFGQLLSNQFRGFLL